MQEPTILPQRPASLRDLQHLIWEVLDSCSRGRHGQHAALWGEEGGVRACAERDWSD